MKRFRAWLRHLLGMIIQRDDVAVIQSPEPTPQPIPNREWPAYRGDLWTIHGPGSGENEIRQGIIERAMAGNTRAIRFVHRGAPPSNDVCAHVFRFRGERKEWPLTTDGWYYKAKRAGINRWIAEISESHRPRWSEIFKEGYTDDDLQIVLYESGKVIRKSEL